MQFRDSIPILLFSFKQHVYTNRGRKTNTNKKFKHCDTRGWSNPLYQVTMKGRRTRLLKDKNRLHPLSANHRWLGKAMPEGNSASLWKWRHLIFSSHHISSHLLISFLNFVLPDRPWTFGQCKHQWRGERRIAEFSRSGYIFTGVLFVLIFVTLWNKDKLFWTNKQRETTQMRIQEMNQRVHMSPCVPMSKKMTWQTWI